MTYVKENDPCLQETSTCVTCGLAIECGCCGCDELPPQMNVAELSQKYGELRQRTAQLVERADGFDERLKEVVELLMKFEKALCVQYDGEVMPEDLYKAYYIWHNEIRPALGIKCPVVEYKGKHGVACPPVSDQKARK